MTTCSVSNCGKTASRRGWCDGHYRRWRRYGDPLGGGTQRGAPLDWLNEVPLKHEDREACLTWPYGTDRLGYGRIKLDGRAQNVSRIVCERRHGPPPRPEYEAAHSCGKGHEACANPWHLDWKTPAENKADQIEHGTIVRGERHKTAKLTEPDVREIKRLIGQGVTHREIGKRFGVAGTTISSIAKGKTWFWMEDV